MHDIDKELRKHKFVIFGSDHYNTLGAVRSLGEVGIRPDVILHPHYRPNPIFTTNSKYIGKVYIVQTVEEGYQTLLEKYADEQEKTFVFSCDDWVESILDTNYDVIKDKFYFFHGKESGIVSHYMDKDAIAKLGMDCGFNIPKAEELKRGEMPTALNYPVITKSIKSIQGGWKKDVFICKTPEELKKAYEKIQSDTILVEEFIEKETEFCYDSFSINDGTVVVMPFKATYLRTKPGSYGNYIKYTPTAEPDIVEKVSKMISKIGFSGIFEAEFLLAKDGTVYFLEINFRNSTWSYPMTFGGVNLLYNWAKGCLTHDVDKNIHKKTSSFIGLVELQDFKDFVLNGNVSFLKWLYELVTADCLFYYNKRDTKPVTAYIYYLLKKYLKKIVRL